MEENMAEQFANITSQLGLLPPKITKKNVSGMSKQV